MRFQTKQLLSIARTFPVWCWVLPWPRGRHPQTWSPRLFSAGRQTWAKVSMLPIYQSSGSLTFWCGSGLTDPDSAPDHALSSVTFKTITKSFFAFYSKKYIYIILQQKKLRFFLLYLLDDVRIRMSQKPTDPDPEQCYLQIQTYSIMFIRIMKCHGWCLEVLPFGEHQYYNMLVTQGKWHKTSASSITVNLTASLHCIIVFFSNNKCALK